jgi:mono/diheme cytochrome c family protein
MAGLFFPSWPGFSSRHGRAFLLVMAGLDPAIPGGTCGCAGSAHSTPAVSAAMAGSGPAVTGKKIAAAMAILLALAAPALAQTDAPDPGKAVFRQKARCMFCHAWDGSGDASEYGGNAPSLRATQLSRAQIEETVRCGRPGTGMPAHEKDAYADGHCYGLKESDLDKDQHPLQPLQYLSDRDIAAVAVYVDTNLKGKGPATDAECIAFFGAPTRACDRYR